MAPPPAERIGPVPGAERITVIDCLRGAALLGIIIANMRGFNSPMAAYFDTRLMWTWMPDRIAQAFVDWFVQGKFITIFATLFGVGFAIQMDRALARGLGVKFYIRRMFVLLMIGLAHSFLLWWGDILVTYAVCGMLLVLFRRRTQKTILVWAHILYWFLLVLFLGFYVAALLGVEMPQEPKPDLAKVLQIYAHGSVQDIFFMRAFEWGEANSFFILVLTNVLALHLFGLYLWRQGYLQRPAESLDWWRKAQRIGLLVGIVGNGVIVAMDWIFRPPEMPPTLPSVVMLSIHWVAVPALSLGYSATVVLLWQSPVWQERLMPFSYVGRMALTNYLMQSLICTTIFYSYGLGLYGRVGPLIDLFLAIVIYSLQVPFSKWWLNGHRFGPMEWVWRRLTYGRLASP